MSSPNNPFQKVKQETVVENVFKPKVQPKPHSKLCWQGLGKLLKLGWTKHVFPPSERQVAEPQNNKFSSVFFFALNTNVCWVGCRAKQLQTNAVELCRKKKDFNSQKGETLCENRTARRTCSDWDYFFIDVVFCIWQTLIYIDLGIDNGEMF